MRCDTDHQPEEREEEQRDRHRAGERDVQTVEQRTPGLALGAPVPGAERQLRSDLKIDAAVAAHLRARAGRSHDDVPVAFRLDDAKIRLEPRGGKVRQLARAQLASHRNLLQLEEGLFAPDEADQQHAIVAHRFASSGSFAEENRRRATAHPATRSAPGGKFASAGPDRWSERRQLLDRERRRFHHPRRRQPVSTLAIVVAHRARPRGCPPISAARRRSRCATG